MSQHSHTPSINLPSLPARVHSGSSFGRRTPQRLSRPGSTAPWDAFDDDSDMGHSIGLPMQLEDDGVYVVVESTPRWRQSVVGWRRGIAGPDASPTASTYTSVYPLSTTPSFSQSTSFDSEAPLSGESGVCSDERGYSDTFGARATPDWAPWLSNSPPSTPRRSHMFDDTLSPSLLARSRAGPRRPILKTSTTFYLPPLYTDQRPTFAKPRRPPRPTSRTSASTATTASSKAREGCFTFCAGRNKTQGGKEVKPQRRPPIAPRGKHYRISFVQDRQWRANILNQAVEESLTNSLFPMPPKPSKSKYTPRSTRTHRTQGPSGTEAPSTDPSIEVPMPVVGRGHDLREGLSSGTTDTATTTKDTIEERELEPEPEPKPEPEPEEAVETIESAESGQVNDEPPEVPEP